VKKVVSKGTGAYVNDTWYNAPEGEVLILPDDVADALVASGAFEYYVEKKRGEA
jgi:hypothetical protein